MTSGGRFPWRLRRPPSAGESLGRVRSNYAGAPGVAACGESLQQGAVLRGVGRRLPSGNLTLLLKMTIYSGFSENGDFP